VFGFAPLLLLGDEDRTSSDLETLLATLRFAVARVDSVAHAVTVISMLLPDVIVARVRDVSRLQRAAWRSGVPVVTARADVREPATLISAIRTAVRTARSQG
jgi:ornithine carbamoyltransferase